MPAINHEARGKIDDMAINFIAKSLRHCPADSQQKRADEINDEGEERLIESSHCVGGLRSRRTTMETMKGPPKLAVSSVVVAARCKVNFFREKAL